MVVSHDRIDGKSQRCRQMERIGRSNPAPSAGRDEVPPRDIDEFDGPEGIRDLGG